MRSKTTLQEEIKQARPFSSPRHEAVISILRTASILKCHLERTAQKEGITIQQFNALRILRGAPDGHTTSDVGDRLIEPNPGASRLMDRMEKNGLIKRTRGGEDRRRVICTISKKGLDILKNLDKPVQDAGTFFLRNLTDKQLVDLNEMLADIRSATK